MEAENDVWKKEYISLGADESVLAERKLALIRENNDVLKSLYGMVVYVVIS